MKKNNNDFFWIGYTDLFTSLFFVMLVLYIITVALLNNNLKASKAVIKKIDEINNAASSLDSNYFRYDTSFRRFSLIQEVNFPQMSASIPPNELLYCKSIGLTIGKLIDSLKIKFSDNQIKYLLVIEGMASNDTYYRNYELSYERSLALYRLWQKDSINLDPDICEVIIGGSGTEGVGRDKIESKNQRFLIQIIPKIGKLQNLNSK